MRVVYSSEHLRHRPTREAVSGRPVGIYEVAERAESILHELRDDAGFDIVSPSEHGAAPISAVHDPAMLSYLEAAWVDWQASDPPGDEVMPDSILHPSLREGMGPSREPSGPAGRIGYWCFDTATPIVEGTYAAARAAVDVALTATDLVLGGDRAAYGLCRPPGHHAARAMFGGYCFFNNAAIAAELISRAAGRVAVLDLDYHHGNGTQQIFYARGDVMYVSLHGDPDRAYPYFSGWPDERGVGEGRGATRNFPLPAQCDDDRYLATVDDAMGGIAGFSPAALVVSLGIDTYEGDPICDLGLTSGAYHAVGRRVADLGLPTVILQEGGYYVPLLGIHVADWLRGLEGRPPGAPRS